jgi:hypothetical protein
MPLAYLLPAGLQRCPLVHPMFKRWHGIQQGDDATAFPTPQAEVNADRTDGKSDEDCKGMRDKQSKGRLQKRVCSASPRMTSSRSLALLQRPPLE